MANTRGDEWEKVLDAPSMQAVRKRLQDIEQRRAELLELGQTMVNQFRRLYPDAPFYLIKFSAKALSEFRWRRSQSAKHAWRGGGSSPGVTLDLTSEHGKTLLMELPQEVREDWLRWESWRVSLNLGLSLCTYEHFRLNDYATRKRLMREMQLEWQGKTK